MKKDYVYIVIIDDQLFDDDAIPTPELHRVQVLKRGPAQISVARCRATRYNVRFPLDIFERRYSATAEAAVERWRSDMRKQIEETSVDLARLHKQILMKPKPVDDDG